MTFDPERVSYAELLDVYWRSFPFQFPAGPGRTRSVLVTRGADQLAEARAAKHALRRAAGERVHVEIVAGGAFWPAERMHQKFDLQRVHPELVQRLAAGDLDAFLASTAAARLNAYVAGQADETAIEDAAHELDWAYQDLLREVRRPVSASP